MHSTACDRCHRRKVRCDKALPQCTPCGRANAECHYMTSEHQVRRRNLQKLERRIRDLESENQSLASKLTRSRSPSNHASTSPTVQNIQPTAQSHHGSNTHESGAVAEQVMHMSLIAGGSDHFVGSASGLLLANLLQTCQTPSSGPSNTYWTANTTSGSQSPDIIPPLPPKSVGRKLVQAYCNHDYLCYPYLSIEKLQQSFDAVYESNVQSTAYDDFIVDMVLAIATAQVHKYNWNGVYDAELHYNRAMLKLGDVMVLGGIHRIQALLLVCQYRMGSTSKNTTASVWHLIGLAARMCLEMGLHRATTYQRLQGDQTLGLGVSCDVPSAKLKRKCFWSLVALDRVTSIALGRPLAIQLEDIDVELPDSEISGQGVASNYPTPTSPLETPDESESTVIFAHVVSYRIVCGRILNSLYRNPKNAPPSQRNFEQIRYELADELREWDLNTGKLPLFPGPSSEHGAIPDSSCFRSAEWWKLLYHNAILMLYRPSPCLCDASRSSATLQRIFDSAQESINLYASLHRSKKMNYSWITMHSVFNAGLSYIYALRNHLQSSKNPVPQNGPQAQLHPKPTITQVFNDTRACSKVLVAVSERWDAAKNCSDLFDRLSDAVVSDIVEAPRVPVADANTSPNNPQNMLVGSHLTPNSTVALHPTEGFYDQAAPSSYLHMTVDHTFKDCFGDLQDLALDEYHNDALSMLSQEWFLGLTGDI
ncbi:transcriptional regulatory protein [Paramyrothecium foliicola]|nr:transcriptional regulatory protein [Paramyrothecium foliicola]